MPRGRPRKLDKQDKDVKLNSNGVWIEDEWGNQGCVYFYNNKYWITHVDGREIITTCLTPDEWEKRNKELIDKRRTT